MRAVFVFAKVLHAASSIFKTCRLEISKKRLCARNVQRDVDKEIFRLYRERTLLEQKHSK